MPCDHRHAREATGSADVRVGAQLPGRNPAQIAGEVDRAEQLANLALQIGTESGEPDAFLLYGTQFMAASWQRGTMGMLIPLVQQAIADNPGVPGLPAALAVAHLEAGENDEARRVLERGLESTTRQDGAWLTETTMFAEVAVECRATDAATRLFESLSPWANQVSSSGMTAEGPVSHYLGGLATVLGRYDEADAYFARFRCLQRPSGCEVLRCPDGPIVGKDAGRAQCCR